ncbi:hypothetical protein [Microbacterium maritypicum]
MNGMRELSTAEQAALIETIGAPPLGNVVAGSVVAREHPDGRVIVLWSGVAVIPRLQFDSVVQTVEAEQREREGWPDADEPRQKPHGRHFAAYGSDLTICGVRVPDAPSPEHGEYLDDRFTTSRARTTCPDCTDKMTGPGIGENP